MISDNKIFWKTIKPFLSDKMTSTQKITLIEKEEIMGDDNTAKVLKLSFLILQVTLRSRNIRKVTL